MLPNSEKDFLKRHIGPSKEDQSKMLKELNYKSLDDLIDNTVPKKIKFNTYVINNGVDIDKWGGVDEKYSLENYPILLTVGSISLRKGQNSVIKFLPQIIKEFPLTHYHCVGNYEDKEDLLKLIKQLNLIIW